MYSDDNSFPGFKRTDIGKGVRWARILKSGDFENREGWNTLEVILEGDRATQLVNGRIVNRALDIRRPDPEDPSRMVGLKRGRILLEEEGAEIWFRNIKVRPLKPTPQS